MRDTHTERPSPGRIPVLSPIVHCVAMTALVFTRSSFGFVFLRPKSVFFAFSWAFILFTIFAWDDSNRWREYTPVCLFGIAAIALYWFHLLIAFSRELYRAGEHDHYSGTSHPLLLVRGVTTPKFEMNLHLWGEPATVLLMAAILRFAFGEHRLSGWLVFVSACMFCAEGMNYWVGVRREKIRTDMVNDTQQGGELLPGRTENGEPMPTRKERVKRQRNTTSDATR
jgi:hypothetical protein